MEWLFLTCHNYWIVCRLVRDDADPFLAYSPMCSIENSSAPFRAFLGAMLSVLKGVPVQPSIFDSDMELDCIPEEEDKGLLPIDDGSGAYPGSLMTHSRGPVDREASEYGLMVRPMPSRYLSRGSLL
jgi:hypothetical protein